MKQKSEAQLKRKLWPLVSAWVKKRDGNICNSCGRVARGYNLHCGHLVPKSIGGVVLALHPLNLHSQCGNCNIWAGGNGAMFAHRLSQKYHFNFVGYFEELRRQTKNVQWDKKKLQLLIDSFAEGEDYGVAFYRIMGVENPLK